MVRLEVMVVFNEKSLKLAAKPCLTVSYSVEVQFKYFAIKVPAVLGL